MQESIEGGFDEDQWTPSKKKKDTSSAIFVGLFEDASSHPNSTPGPKDKKSLDTFSLQCM